MAYNIIYFYMSQFQNVPSGSISVLGRRTQSSKYLVYVYGWPRRPALILNPIERFEIGSHNKGK
jgi:hypothetical protein